MDSFTLPKDLRQYYERAQQTIQATRKYFRIQRRKRRIQTRLATDRLQRRYRTDFRSGDPIFVSKPSFTRVEGIKGLKKLEGQHRGPYKVISTDNHNNINVLVDMDGTEKKISVETCEKAHTFNPKDRFPPQYKHGLRYDPLEPIEEEEQAPDENKDQESKQDLHSKKRRKETNTTPRKKIRNQKGVEIGGAEDVVGGDCVSERGMDNDPRGSLWTMVL